MEGRDSAQLLAQFRRHRRRSRGCAASRDRFCGPGGILPHSIQVPKTHSLGRACEMLALGVNPYSFFKVPGVLIDTGAPGTIDETFAHKPSVVTHEGVLYHFYCAVSGKYPNEVRGIAVARSAPW